MRVLAVAGLGLLVISCNAADSGISSKEAANQISHLLGDGCQGWTIQNVRVLTQQAPSPTVREVSAAVTVKQNIDPTLVVLNQPPCASRQNAAQRQMADALGRSDATVSTWENHFTFEKWSSGWRVAAQQSRPAF
jgi:hypothetical protein